MSYTQAKRPPRSEYDETVWDALPGSTEDLVYKTGVPASAVRKLLRRWQDNGFVERQTQFFGSCCYTWIYFLTEKVDGFKIKRR